MIRNKPVTVPRRCNPEADAELVSILSDISVVSRRIARRLSLMEQRLSYEGGDPNRATKTRHAR